MIIKGNMVPSKDVSNKRKWLDLRGANSRSYTRKYPVSYSHRSAVIGSTARARSEGTRQARAATTIINSETPNTVKGS